MITLYSMPSSGNSYKVRLLLAQLGIPFRHVATEPDDGNNLTSQPEFLLKNPLGKVPVLELPDGRVLSESNAILLHLAEGSPFLPHDAWERALAWQWMFFEQYSHEPNIAVRQSLLKYPHRAAQATPERLEALLDGGNRALDAMEHRLADAPYLTGDTYCVADIALYGYTHSAESGGFDLSSRPHIRAWLTRVRDQDGHVTIDWLPENPGTC